MGELFTRFEGNPIISPDNKSWRQIGTFNPTAIELEGKIFILFRALSVDKTSTIGLAISRDGFNVDEILDEPIYVPRAKFEAKRVEGHSGCEDPRVVQIDDILYMFYTAYDGVNPPKVALTWIYVDDFIELRWNWAMPRILSPPLTDDKDACIISERFDKGFFYIHRAGGVNMVYDYIEDPRVIEPTQLKSHLLLKPRQDWWDCLKVGLASPPIKTSRGWLALYHGVSSDYIHRVGAVLLDPKLPHRVLARTSEYLLSPIYDYEKYGYVNNVVFPCGAIVRGNDLVIYYGGADKYVCVAKARLSDVLSMLCYLGL
jgi:predicted GH43/DUF377 family glycosyl hydrolase